MDLLDDLGNDLALAFLVEKKHTKKIDSKGALALIGRIKDVLRPVSLEEEKRHESAFPTEKSIRFSSY